MQVVVDSLLVSYKSSGKGKVILLLHGWADNSKSWAEIQNSLSEHYQVIALDLPGFGASQAPENAWGLAEYANFIQEFTKKINIKIFALAGHSNGAAIAIKLLADSKENNFNDTEKLILISSAGIRGEEKTRLQLLKYATKAGKLITKPLPATVKSKLRTKLYSSVGSDMLIAEHMQETFKKVVNEDVRHLASRIQIPTLLVYGDQDQSTPLKYGQIFEVIIKNSKLKVIPNGSHFLLTENSSDVATLISEFLND